MPTLVFFQLQQRHLESSWRVPLKGVVPELMCTGQTPQPLLLRFWLSVLQGQVMLMLAPSAWSFQPWTGSGRNLLQRWLNPVPAFSTSPLIPIRTPTWPFPTCGPQVANPPPLEGQVLLLRPLCFPMKRAFGRGLLHQCPL